MEQINYETTGVGCTERQLYSSIPNFIDMTAGIPGCTDSRKYSGILKDTVPFVAAGYPAFCSYCTNLQNYSFILNDSSHALGTPKIGCYCRDSSRKYSEYLIDSDLDPIPGENKYSTIINGQLNNQYSTIFNGLNNDGTFHYSDGTYNNLQSTFR